MADYQCWCLWNMDDPDNIDPETLSLSKEMKRRLFNWSLEFDKTLDLEDHTKIGFISDREFQEFYDQGWLLFKN